MICSYRDLLVWQRGMELVTQIYQATSSYPSSEAFGLISQLRRCAVSIPSNIAEGYGRNSTLDYARFLGIARGSLYELETQLQISRNLEFINDETHETFNTTTFELRRMLSSLITKLKERNKHS
jgi:four helix bundle protein